MSNISRSFFDGSEEMKLSFKKNRNFKKIGQCLKRRKLGVCGGDSEMTDFCWKNVGGEEMKLSFTKIEISRKLVLCVKSEVKVT